MKNFTKKLKLAFVLDDSLDTNDGVQQYVRTLGGWLSQQGHQVHYLVGQTNTNNPAVHSLSNNVSVRFNGNRLSVPLTASTKAIKALLQTQPYDILHVQMPYSPILSGKIISHAPRHTAITGTFHIMPLGVLQKFGGRLLKIAQAGTLRKFSAVASVSPAAQDFAISTFGLKSKVIPNMVDISKWRSDEKNISGRIVFLGRLVRRKGCRHLLAALARMPSTILSKVEVIIAGDGPERQALEEFVASAKLPYIRFMGYIPESAKVSLLASAELAVFPSLGGESFGIVLIEAMAAGSGVVIGGNNAGYSNVLGRQSKALINPRDTLVFSHALQVLLTDKVLRDRIHEQQHQIVSQYDVNVVGPKIVKMYEEAIVLHHKQKVRQ